MEKEERQLEGRYGRPPLGDRGIGYEDEKERCRLGKNIEGSVERG